MVHLWDMLFNRRRGNHNLNSGNDTSNRSTPQTQGTFRIPIYGATSGPTSKIVPVDQRLSYSWSDVNVFVTVDTTANTAFCSWLSCFKKDRDKNVMRKHILKNATGIAHPGELLAIMGSSGAGKTTLLNALTFRNSKKYTVTGLRCVNGQPVTPKSLISQSAYVQQDDLFIGCLTVRENLVFQALVRMDRWISYEERIKRVEEVLQEFALQKCQNTAIGVRGRIKGISGGERKRLAFAAEVLTNPRLMFCDEPTSGLDSFMALNVIQNLKNLALTGKTVICTIHQPSSELYAMFDKLLLMSEGRMAFLGTPEEADLFFTSLHVPCPKNFNPADYFIQLLGLVPGEEVQCRQKINEICDTFETSRLGVKVAVEACTKKEDVAYNEIWIGSDAYKSPYKASWCSQFRAVLWRSWISIIKEPLLIKVRVVQTMMVSTLVGAIYFGQEMTQDGVMNINGALFIFLTNMTFQNVFAVITVFCSEIPIFLREHRNGMYRTDVYFLCKTLAETPLFLVIPVLFILISYYMIGLNSDVSRFFIACGIIILVTNVAVSFGYFVSCVSSTIPMALTLGPTLIIPFLLFGGFFLNIDSIPIYLRWLSYFSWFRYGNEALMINQWQGVENITCNIDASACPRSGHIVLEIFNFSEDQLIPDICYLTALVVFFRTFAFLGLLIRSKRTE